MGQARGPNALPDAPVSTPLAPHPRAALPSGSPPQLREEQLGVLLELKRQDKARSKGSFDGVIHSWETAFYSNLVEKRDYDVDQQKLKEYFPLEVGGCRGNWGWQTACGRAGAWRHLPWSQLTCCEDSAHS